MPSLDDIIKPKLRIKLRTKSIPNFLPKKSDSNVSHQASIWDNKTYQVNPRTHVFTTIQEHYGNKLISSLGLPEDAVVVDVGCFIGEKLWQIKSDKPYLGVGVDIALDALKTAKNIDCFGHNFIAANMEDLPFKNSSVDLVMVFDVIEHLTNAEKGFVEIARILKPGGRLLLHVPVSDNKWSMFWWKQKLFPHIAESDYQEVGHSPERMLSRRQIRKYLHTYGLKVNKELPYNSFFVHLFDRELFKILALLSVRIFRAGNSLSKSTRTTHSGNLGTSRIIYGKYLIPVLEILSSPDYLLSKLGIGNTCFYLAQKQE